MIKSFRNQYFFLSNFYDLERNHGFSITLNGHDCRTSEHAYQMMKFKDKGIIREIVNAKNAGQAKGLARKYKDKVRDGWHEKKVEIMRQILEVKFSNNNLKELLINTGSDDLVEGNTHGDTFWGVVGTTGKNHLGNLLMEIRFKLATNG